MRDPVNTVVLLGTGLIGSGWAARCLAHGLDVVAWDPDPSAEATLVANVDNAWPILEEVGPVSYTHLTLPTILLV